MSEKTAFSGWDDIDAAGEAGSFQSYLDAVTGLERIEALKRRSDKLLSPAAGDSVLDVGCGNGDDVRALADEVGSGGLVVGVDNSGEMVEEAGDRSAASDPSTFLTADTESLPFDDGAFDGCRSDRVLQHLQRPRVAFAELQRVTRPGGRVVVTNSDWGTMVVDPAPDGVEPTAERILDAMWSCAQNGRVGRRLRRWAVDAGLVDIDVDTATIALAEFETADEVLGLTGRAESIREANAVPEEEIERWLDTLRSADEVGSFFASLSLRRRFEASASGLAPVVLHTVAGTVPESPA